VRIGRRPLFFLSTAVVCLALLAATPAEFRWVNLGCAGLAVFWATLLSIEDISNARGGSPGKKRPAAR
jgi:hypothetical protein